MTPYTFPQALRRHPDTTWPGKGRVLCQDGNTSTMVSNEPVEVRSGITISQILTSVAAGKGLEFFLRYQRDALLIKFGSSAHVS